MKVCKICQQEKSNEMYPKGAGCKDNLRPECKVCFYESRKNYNKLNRAKINEWKRKSSIRRKLNISIQDYELMFSSQDGKCRICLTTNPNGEDKNGTKKHFAIDHCHKTNKIRGLLCNTCNTGLGLFNDSVERLTEAIEYLRQNNA